MPFSEYADSNGLHVKVMESGLIFVICENDAQARGLYNLRDVSVVTAYGLCRWLLKK